MSLPDHVGDAAMQHWVAKYGILQPFDTWRAAPPEKAPDVAFRAIATEAELLWRIDGREARRLAAQAEQMVGHIQALGGNASTAMTTAATIVLDRIHRWRNRASQLGGSPDSAAEAARQRSLGPPENSRIPQEIRAVWGNAFDNYPQFEPKTGAAVASTLMTLGTDGIARLKDPMNDILTVVASRFAARSGRGAYKDQALPHDRCLEVIGMVGDYAARAGKPALPVGYEGRVGTYAERSHTLAYDALTCLELATEIADSRGAAILEPWERAAERHCYVALSLNPGIFRAMDYEKGRAFAAAAARHAQGLVQQPAIVSPPELPDFLEPLSPRVLLAMATRLLPDGIPARQSGLATDDAGPEAASVTASP